MITSLRSSPGRLRLVVAVVYAVGLFCMAAAAMMSGRVVGVSAAHVALAFGLVAAAELAVMHLRFGGERYTYTWSEAAAVLGLVLVPYPCLALIAPLAVGLTHSVSGRATVKVYYNALAAAIAVTGARLALIAVAGTADVSPVEGSRSWLALAAAAVTYCAINSTTTTAAVAASQDLAFATVLRRHLPATSGVLVGNTLVAALLLQIQWNKATVAVLPFLLGLLYSTYRSSLAAREDRDIWRQLEAASKDLATLDVDRVAAAAIARARRLARADEVELLVCRTDGGEVDRYAVGEDGDCRRDVHAASVVDLPDLRSGVLVSASVETVDDDGVSTASHVLTLRLDSPENDEPLGALRYLFRSDVKLTDRERQVLVTFGRSVAASVYNAQLHERTRKASLRHEHAATHDALTGLPNRSLLVRQASAHVEHDGAVSLLLVDLDHFKSINDTLGHPTGDRLLQAAAQRLTEVVRRTDTIARLGGDEFAILLPGLRSTDLAESIARDVLRALAMPVVIDGLRLSVEGSVGISHFPQDAAGVDEMLAHADIALYQAKTARGSFRTYHRDHDDSSVSRLTLAAELRSALARDELVLHFQPQYAVDGVRLLGAEALVRWQHPTRGLLPPTEFISLAEDSGLAHSFTMNVLAKAIGEAARWRRAGADLHVAVNLSARNLLDPELPVSIAAALERHDVPASVLVLEITERTMLSELDVVERVLAELRLLGVQLSVDDFGTGYSSMTFLTRAAVNELKVDRGFVSRMTHSDSDAAIVRATIELAHGLGLRVVAEGVEDDLTLQELRRLGCDTAQGYHLGAPMPAADFHEHMRAALPATAVRDGVPRQRSESAETARVVAFPLR